jgi:hypothetical protein
MSDMHHSAKPQLALTDLVKASMSIRLNETDRNLSKDLIILRLKYLILIVKEFKALRQTQPDSYQ